MGKGGGEALGPKGNYFSSDSSAAVSSAGASVSAASSALASSAANKPAIPKRGDKEFEPSGGVEGGGVGTNLQQHKLERIRDAMFSALDVERTVSRCVHGTFW